MEVTNAVPQKAEYVTFKKPPTSVEVGPLKFWALGDRVIVREDAFKSGYECPTCGGSGRVPSTVVASATTTCPDCDGKGGVLAIPDVAQRRPTTGIVESCGPKVETLKEGDTVMYSNFAGYVVDLNPAGENVTLRILHETEVLCGFSGQLELRTLKGKTEIATFNS